MDLSEVIILVRVIAHGPNEARRRRLRFGFLAHLHQPTHAAAVVYIKLWRATVHIFFDEFVFGIGIRRSILPAFTIHQIERCNVARIVPKHAPEDRPRWPPFRLSNACSFRGHPGGAGRHAASKTRRLPREPDTTGGLNASCSPIPRSKWQNGLNRGSLSARSPHRFWCIRGRLSLDAAAFSASHASQLRRI